MLGWLVSLIPFLVSLLCVSAVVTGSKLLAWLSVPILFWTLLVLWGTRVAFLQNLASLPRLRPIAASDQCSAQLPGVSVISPARNEELGVEPAVRSLMLQDYPALEVLVIDDHSTDATPAILERLASQSSRLRVLRPPDLPAGWAGKPYASWFAFLNSDPANKWLLFTDARVLFHPGAVCAAIAYAETEQLDFLSCIFRFEGEGLAEGLIAATQSRFVVLGSRKFRGGDPDLPVGIGAFTLIRRSLYSDSGGHSVFRTSPVEDFMLAKLAKHHGAKMSVALAPQLISLRRYHGLPDICRRIPRGLRIAASDQPLSLVRRVALELIVYVAPFCLALAGLVRLLTSHRLDSAFLMFTLFAGLSYLAGVLYLQSSAAVSRFRPLVAWLHPLGALLWIWLVGQAITGCLSGAPLFWRNRTMPAPRFARKKRNNRDRAVDQTHAKGEATT